MINPRTVCFVYFALLFGTPHAEPIKKNETTSEKKNVMSTTITTTAIMPASNISEKASEVNPAKETSTTSFCTQITPKPEEGHCIFSLPSGKDTLILIVTGLTVGCLALLLTTLICACQVCHLRGIISSLQPRHDNIDRHARRERSESQYQDEGQVDRHPTETCFMLSEVTTAQEESREYQNKTEEENDTESPVKDSNGDIAQENSPEPDAKAPESSDTGV